LDNMIAEVINEDELAPAEVKPAPLSTLTRPQENTYEIEHV